MRISFSGVARTLSTSELGCLEDVIASLGIGEEFTTGLAEGVDFAAGVFASHLFPEAIHRVIVPQAPHASLDEFLAMCRGNIQVIKAPAGKDYGDSYMRRNDMLVEHCDKLVAFPETREEQLRSGTWATIRRAEKAGKLTEVWGWDVFHEGGRV